MVVFGKEFTFPFKKMQQIATTSNSIRHCHYLFYHENILDMAVRRDL